MRKRTWLAGAQAAALVALAAGLARADAPRRYAVVVGNNHSLDEGVPRLSYADDDALKYFELLQAAGVEVWLLAVADPDAQQRFPAATRVAAPPSRRELMKALASAFTKIEADQVAGRESHFFFVYSGHGGLGAGREGYVNLLDGRLARSELYREVIARSPATYNHLIIDACHAYYLVQKRGGSDSDKQGDYTASVGDFLRAEELTSYPNTGVILAASSEAETHEWSRWEAGIFSHELRSALLGGADVDGDGAVTYSEAAAFVEAANSAIDVPQARLRVWYRAPARDVRAPLLGPGAFSRGPFLRIEKEDAQRFHVEDSRGVPVADLHPSNEQAVRLALVGAAPFYLRAEGREATVPDGPETTTRELVFSASSASSKGSVEASFRRNLFKVPFGGGFYRGLLAAPAHPDAPSAHRDAPAPRLLRVLGWAGIGLGAAAGVAGGFTMAAASRAHSDYEQAPTQAAAIDAHRRTDRWSWASYGLWAAGGALLTTGACLLVADHRAAGATPKMMPLATVGDGAFSLGVTGSW
ncbi:MAG: caspase family protein [Deltaproteobacteria bacterium]|nr:caspase family protein [Deltaproteobacteria bacterium]